MTRDRGGLRPGIGLCVVLLAAGGCTDTTRPDVDELPSPAPATSTGPVRPDPNYDRERTEAGQELLATAFPRPEDLGPGWEVAGVGPPGTLRGTEREVAEVVDGSIPRGCSRLAPLPLPVAAAEVRYTVHGTPVSAFVLGFEEPAVTRAFVSLLVGNLEDCKAERSEDGADLVGQVVSLGEGVVLSDRYPDREDRRSDLSVLAGTRVVLLEAPVALGEAPFTSRGSVRIAEVFRSRAGGQPSPERR